MSDPVVSAIEKIMWNPWASLGIESMSWLRLIARSVARHYDDGTGRCIECGDKWPCEPYQDAADTFRVQL